MDWRKYAIILITCLRPILTVTSLWNTETFIDTITLIQILMVAQNRTHLKSEPRCAIRQCSIFKFLCTSSLYFGSCITVLGPSLDKIYNGGWTSFYMNIVLPVSVWIVLPTSKDIISTTFHCCDSFGLLTFYLTWNIETAFVSSRLCKFIWLGSIS